jgi:ABC-type thiamine transport system ATPase subunit
MNFHPKITASVLAGALTSLLVSEAARHGWAVSGDEGAAITTLLSFIAGYFTPSNGDSSK